MEPQKHNVREGNSEEMIWLNLKNTESTLTKLSQTNPLTMPRGSSGGEKQDELWHWEPSCLSPKKYDVSESLFSQRGKEPLAPVYNPKDILRMGTKIGSRTDVDHYTNRQRSLSLDSYNYGKNPVQVGGNKPKSGDPMRRVQNKSNPLFTVPSITISAVSQESVLLDQDEPAIDRQTTLPDINTDRCFSVFTPAPGEKNRLTLPQLDQPLKAFMPPRRRPSQEYGHKIALPRIDSNYASNKEKKSIKATRKYILFRE